MIKNVIDTMVTAARGLLKDWRLMAAFFGLYVALSVAVSLFVVTRESSIWQLLLTLLLAAAALLLFFVLQVLAVSYTQNEARLGVLFPRSLKIFWKLIVVSLPIFLLGCLLAYLLGKLQAQISVAPPLVRPSGRGSAPPSQWLGVVVTGLWYLLLCLVLPLATFHLWIVTTREGLGAALKQVGRVLARAFAPRSVLIYVVGLAVFGLIPCLLLFTKTPVKSWWIDVGLLGARDVLAFLIALFGWVITLGSLAEVATRSAGGAEHQ